MAPKQHEYVFVGAERAVKLLAWTKRDQVVLDTGQFFSASETALYYAEEAYIEK